MTPPPLTFDERLPTPRLDDRRFQDLVDEAKRRVQTRCPEWTDHNVSDPGVTLIETFAWMTDQLLYRLNRVPDLNYVKFLELIGVTLLPPRAARTELTFRVSKEPENELPILHLRLRKAARGGAKIFVIHPRRTRLWDVAEHLTCRPGDEGEILGRIARDHIGHQLAGSRADPEAVAGKPGRDEEARHGLDRRDHRYGIRHDVDHAAEPGQSRAQANRA